jgi:hypothetical protein
VRVGFQDAHRQQDYAGILTVAARLPEAMLREGRTILTYYDLVQMEAVRSAYLSARCSGCRAAPSRRK